MLEWQMWGISSFILSSLPSPVGVLSRASFCLWYPEGKRRNYSLLGSYLDFCPCPSALVMIFPASSQFIWKMLFEFFCSPGNHVGNRGTSGSQQLSLCYEWLSPLASGLEVLILTQCLLPEMLAGHQALIYYRETQGLSAFKSVPLDSQVLSVRVEGICRHVHFLN